MGCTAEGGSLQKPGGEVHMSPPPWNPLDLPAVPALRRVLVEALCVWPVSFPRDGQPGRRKENAMSPRHPATRP